MSPAVLGAPYSSNSRIRSPNCPCKSPKILMGACSSRQSQAHQQGLAAATEELVLLPVAVSAACCRVHPCYAPALTLSSSTLFSCLNSRSALSHSSTISSACTQQQQQQPKHLSARARLATPAHAACQISGCMLGCMRSPCSQHESSALHKTCLTNTNSMQHSFRSTNAHLHALTDSMKCLSSWLGFHWRGRNSSLMTRLCTPGMLTVRWNMGVLPSGVPLS